MSTIRTERWPCILLLYSSAEIKMQGGSIPLGILGRILFGWVQAPEA